MAEDLPGGAEGEIIVRTDLLVGDEPAVRELAIVAPVGVSIQQVVVDARE